MIQFNLLPDVKIEYIKTRYRKRLIIAISTISTVAFLSIFILLFLFVRVSQKKHISDLDKDIKSNVSAIQSTQDIDKILTIQNQLNSLPDIYDKRVVSSRLIGFLGQVTPEQVTISNTDVDFTLNTITLKGNADSLTTINKYTDTLKFTDFKINNAGGATEKAFSNVVLNSFSPAITGKNDAGYDISFTFNPAIFASVKDATSSPEVSLVVPSITSTRSETEKPLFAPQPAKTEGQR